MTKRMYSLLLLLTHGMFFILMGSAYGGDFSQLNRVGETIRVFVDTSAARDVQYQDDLGNQNLMEVEGMVLTSHGNAIIIEDKFSSTGTRTIALHDVRAGFVYGGKKNQGVNGIVAGGVLGVLVAVLIDSDGDDGGRSFPSNYSERENGLGHYLLFAGLGAFVGGTAGFLIEEEVWHRVEDNGPGVSVGLGYNLDTRQVVLSLNF